MRSATTRTISGRVYNGQVTHANGCDISAARISQGVYDVYFPTRIIGVAVTCDPSWALRFYTAQILDGGRRLRVTMYNMAEAVFDGSFFFMATVAA